jgi:hypothetical protein
MERRKWVSRQSFTGFEHLQILIGSVTVSALLYPFMGPASFFAYFFILVTVESVKKLIYRKEVVCPYCGFDPVLYTKDIKKARLKIQDHLQENKHLKLSAPQKKNLLMTRL